MLKNYLKIAWRNIVNNPVFTIINVFGLTIGISTCLVIFLIVNFELSFDKFHTDGERIYRMYSQFQGVFSGVNRGVASAVAPYVKDNFSGIESATHFHTFSASVTIHDGGEPVRYDRQGNMAIVEPEYFEVFNNYEWLYGDAISSLSKPFQVVLTESKARKYFSEPQSVGRLIGREIIYNDSLVLNISGIIKDIPHNTDLVFTDFISYATIESSWLKDNYYTNDWTSTNSSSQFFIKLEQETKLSNILDQIPLLHEKSAEEDPNSDFNAVFNLQGLSDLHFNKDLGIFDNSRSVAHIPTLKSLILVAFLLLLIASVNFINLSTAQATRRAKEIGVRKVMGSSRKMLVLQFLSESTLISLFAVILALPITEMVLIFFSEFIPKGVILDLNHMNTLGFLVLMVVVVGVVSGLYPAFVISSYQPVKALKDKVYAGGASTLSGLLRKGLTVFQFTFAQALIACAIIISLQLGFMMKKDLGFQKDAIMYFNTPWGESGSKRDALVNNLNQLAELKEVSVHQSPPASRNLYTSMTTYKYEGGELKHNVHRKVGDTDFISFYGMQLLAGRNYIASDSARELVINETYARQLGFSKLDDVLDEVIFTQRDEPFTIVGVVKDFHFQSMHHEINPMAIYYGKGGGTIGLKFDSNDKQSVNIKQAIENLTASWKDIYPDHPLNYYFMDEAVRLFYESEQKTAKLVNTATAIAILISCLGLFGLASFTTVQRTKEIGVRKVLGATVSNIVILISKDFIKLVLIAFFIAAPLGYWLAQQWISDFAYRMEISIWIFIATGFLSVTIAFITLSYQALKAAMTDPVNSLRYE